MDGRLSQIIPAFTVDGLSLERSGFLAKLPATDALTLPLAGNFAERNR